MGRYDNWNRILELIQKEVDRRFRERSPEWEVRVPFFNEVLAHLHAVKNLGGHLKTGQSWTGENRPVGEPPQARVLYRN